MYMSMYLTRKYLIVVCNLLILLQRKVGYVSEPTSSAHAIARAKHSSLCHHCDAVGWLSRREELRYCTWDHRALAQCRWQHWRGLPADRWREHFHLHRIVREGSCRCL